MCGCEKGKDKGDNKHTCKIQKFTLILTLKFQSGKTVPSKYLRPLKHPLKNNLNLSNI